VAGILNRLAQVLANEVEDRPALEAKTKDPEANRQGLQTWALSASHRFRSVALLRLNADAQAFVDELRISVRLCLDVVARFESGDPIPESFVSMLLYKSLFDALASGDLELARKMASAMGGRDKIERKHDHPFDYALGYTLKYFTLEDRPQMDRWAAEFARVCEEQENADFRGYAEAFTAILAGDDRSLDAAFKNIIAGHKRQSKGAGVFRDTEDELLCVWGVGLAGETPRARRHGRRSASSGGVDPGPAPATRIIREAPAMPRTAGVRRTL
jgi:hypothetical protein